MDNHPGWNIIVARVGQEISVAASLTAYGIKAYCPQLPPRRRVKRGRIVRETQAMVPGYIFVPAVAQNWARIRMTRGVRTSRPWLEINGAPARLSHSAISKIEEQERDPKSLKAKITPGMKIRVTDPLSPFAELMGEVERIGDKGLLRALISLFNRKVPVEFGEEQVEAA